MKTISKVSTALLVALCWGMAARGAEVSFFTEGVALPSGLPFSEAVRVDDTLYLSGQVAVKPGTLELVEGGIEAETRQVLENIRLVLEANGLDLSNVVKCLVMLEDIGEWGTFNEIYSAVFKPPFPARSAFGAEGLALGARVEVECIAAFP